MPTLQDLKSSKHKFTINSNGEIIANFDGLARNKEDRRKLQLAAKGAKNLSFMIAHSKQEPLGNDFEKVLNENLYDLYGS